MPKHTASWIQGEPRLTRGTGRRTGVQPFPAGLRNGIIARKLANVSCPPLSSVKACSGLRNRGYLLGSGVA